MSKKVLFILPSLAVGGLERVQVTIANKLCKQGFDITIMILEPVDTLKTELDSSIRLIYKPYRKHLGQRIPYIRHKFYDDGMWETRATPEQLHEYYVGNDYYDVEIAFFRGLSIKIVSGGIKKNHNDFRKNRCAQKKINTDFSENVVQRELERKRIAWVHNDFRRATGYANNFKSMRDVFKAYSLFDNVVCVSEEAKNGFIEVIGDTGNLTRIYNILPVESIKEKAQELPTVHVPKEQFHLVIVGRLLDSAKGQKRLINVVARLHDEGKSISLALVGGGNDEQMLKEEIAAKHAGDYIKMCGNQINPYPFIKEADMLVCASYYEGYNLTVAEALILGVPVLSTNCTGPSEILDCGKYGIIVENSEDGLYHGLKKLAESPDQLDKIRKKANNRRSFFDEEKLLNQITDLLKRE